MRLLSIDSASLRCRICVVRQYSLDYRRLLWTTEDYFHGAAMEQKVSVPDPPGISIAENDKIFSFDEIEISHFDKPEVVAETPLQPRIPKR